MQLFIVLACMQPYLLVSLETQPSPLACGLIACGIIAWGLLLLLGCLCRCAVLAAANPSFGSFDDAQDTTEQHEFKATILSR